tara:strand:- start:580 stop:918 length:339 start_codon:yes stop_codon:yes gene_type:complete
MIKETFNLPSLTIIDLYILLIYGIQTILFINMIISIYYRIFRKDKLVIIDNLKKRKSTINFYLLIAISALMIFLFNPFNTNNIEVKDELKSVLFTASITQIIFLLQKENNSL